MLLNERDTDEGLLVSVCDPDDLGETYENGSVSLTVEPEFYDGEVASEAEVLDSLERCTTANLVGEECVTVAIEAGLVDEERVLDLDGARHAQLLWL